MSLPAPKLIRFSDHLLTLPRISPRCRSSGSWFPRVPNHIARISTPLVHSYSCSKNEPIEVEASNADDDQKSEREPVEGLEIKNENNLRGFSSKELIQRLQRYGVAGILSYGLLNTLYYSTVFIIVSLYFAPAPARTGYAAAVQRFLKIMAMVWAGSQVTKIVRAGGALALAPFVARGLSWFTCKFKFESEGKAFAVIVGLCLGLALILFVGFTLISA